MPVSDEMADRAGSMPRGAGYVVLKSINLGERYYEPGELIDTDHLKLLSHRRRAQLVSQHRIAFDLGDAAPVTEKKVNPPAPAAAVKRDGSGKAGAKADPVPLVAPAEPTAPSAPAGGDDDELDDDEPTESDVGKTVLIEKAGSIPAKD